MFPIKDKLYDPDSFDIAQNILAMVRERYEDQPTAAVIGGLWLAMQGVQGPEVAANLMKAYSLTLASK